MAAAVAVRSSGLEKQSMDTGKYVRYTAEQVEALERVYAECPKPSSMRRQQLIRECPLLANTEHKQIKIWFQNRSWNDGILVTANTTSAPKASATPKPSCVGAGSINQKRSLIPESRGPPTSSVSATNSSASIISEYLIKTCPGWRVEDLLMDDADATVKEVGASYYQTGRSLERGSVNGEGVEDSPTFD